MDEGANAVGSSVAMLVGHHHHGADRMIDDTHEEVDGDKVEDEQAEADFIAAGTGPGDKEHKNIVQRADNAQAKGHNSPEIQFQSTITEKSLIAGGIWSIAWLVIHHVGAVIPNGKENSPLWSTSKIHFFRSDIGREAIAWRYVIKAVPKFREINLSS